MKNKINVIEEYFNINDTDERCKCIGISRIAPLILIINDDEKIVKELLKDTDFENKCNLLSFLDYSIVEFRRRMIKNDINYKKYNDLYSDIKFVLNVFNRTIDKWSIDGETFVKILLKEV